MTISRRDMLSTLALATAGVSLLSAAPAFADDSVPMLKLMAPGALPDIPLGNKDAKVTIVEYASMTCPHCARFATTVFPEFKTKYIDTGKVLYIFREFPLDARAAAGSMLARCAPEDKFYPITAALFETQKDWVLADDPVTAMLNLAKQFGYTQESFEKCLNDGDLYNKVTAVRDRASKDFTVDSTPTFFINGTRAKGEQTVDALSKIIDPLL